MSGICAKNAKRRSKQWGKCYGYDAVEGLKCGTMHNASQERQTHAHSRVPLLTKAPGLTLKVLPPRNNAIVKCERQRIGDSCPPLY